MDSLESDKPGEEVVGDSDAGEIRLTYGGSVYADILQFVHQINQRQKGMKGSEACLLRKKREKNSVNKNSADGKTCPKRRRQKRERKMPHAKGKREKAKSIGLLSFKDSVPLALRRRLKLLKADGRLLGNS